MDPQLTSAETVASAAPSTPPLSRITSTNVEEDGRFAPGTLLNGRYRISGLLGRGAMGEVYRATDLTLGQSVALKFLPESAGGNERLLERFHGEVRVARQVSHPNVCRVYDIGEVDGAPFISMEYVDGEDLASLLQRIGRLPSDKALEISRKICAGLAAAHDKGIIHRDLKPQNIMLNKRGEALIMDFGLAAVADSLTGAEARNGTPAYMAPEQLRGLEVTARSDIYSLGAVLYELYTGRRPYDAKTVQQMLDMQDGLKMAGLTTIATDVDPLVEKVIRRCLDPDPAKRPATPMAVAAALPGGDPLAAALAAGETLSPEAVANAGSTAGLDRKWALLCLGVAIASLMAMIPLRDRNTPYFLTRLEHSPDVLKLKAREHASALGFAKKPADTWIDMQARNGLIGFLQRRNPSHADWRRWFAAEAPAMAWVRESPGELLSWPSGLVSLDSPPLNRPGMTQVDMDMHGRLRGFIGVPDSTQDVPQPIEPEAVFQRAGLDFSQFAEQLPITLPNVPAGKLRGWKGPHPSLPDAQLVVDIGWWKNQVTWVAIRWPWMLPSSGGGGGGGNRGAPVLRMVRFTLVAGFWFLGSFLAILLAIRNWKQGRVDKAGAFKLALAQVLLGIVVWICLVHPNPNGIMMDFFVNDLATRGLFSALLIAVLYLALEPTIRARWPQAVITWNRLLAGRFGDPQVAGHILIGAAVGMAIFVLLSLAAPNFHTPAMSPMLGPRQWASGFPGSIASSLRLGMVIVFALFCLRWALRREWLAALVGALLFALADREVANQGVYWIAEFALYVTVFAVIGTVLLRTGLVTAIAAIVFIDLMSDFLLSSDWTIWHAGQGFATLTLLLCVVLLAFWKSLGSRGLLDPPDSA